MKQSDKKKQKLTLSVDPDVVKKARGLGINISEITEGILRGFSFTPSGAETAALYEKYKQLFETMRPLLQKYGVPVEVGSFEIADVQGGVYGTSEIFLSTDGTFWLTEIEQTVRDIQKITLSDFYKPKIILSNFIKALSRGAEDRKQQLTELEMARRIIEAISGAPKKVSFKSKIKKSDKNRQGKK